MDVEVQVMGLDVLNTRLDALADSFVTGMSKANEAIGEALVKYYGGVAYDDRGRQFGMEWPPLADATVAEKSKKYDGAPIMVRTGEMRASFEAKITPLTITIGNTAPYFKYHQSSAPRTRLPRRVMLGINAAVEAMVVTGYSSYIAGVIKGV